MTEQLKPEKGQESIDPPYVDPELAEIEEIDTSSVPTDRLETLSIEVGSAPRQFVIAKESVPAESPISESDPMSEGQYTPHVADYIKYKGQYEAMNGFIAFVPDREEVKYCLVPDTKENKDKLVAAGYKSSGGALGVLSFRGEETLAPRIGGAEDVRVIQSQIEYMKAIGDLESNERFLEQTKEGTDVEQIKKMEARVAEDTARVADRKKTLEEVIRNNPRLFTNTI